MTYFTLLLLPGLLLYILIWFTISVIISTPAFPAVSTISDTTFDSPAAFLFPILLINSLTMSLSIEQGMLVIVSANYCCPMQTLWQLFQSLFFSSLIIILLTSNILISFEHPLCNLKNIAFLIIPPHNVFNSFPFFFLYLAWQTILFASRYFSLLMFPCFHSFHSFYFSLTHSVRLDTDPPSKPQPSNFFCARGPKKINKSPQVDKQLIIPIFPHV